MRAECVHMRPTSDLTRESNGFGGSRIACGAANTCQAGSGYTYGAAWLYEQPPAVVLAELDRLQDLPAGNLPGWLEFPEYDPNA
jgi:hypothetical protein